MIEVVDVKNLYGTQLELTYDPSLVEVVDADPDTPGTQVRLGTVWVPSYQCGGTVFLVALWGEARSSTREATATKKHTKHCFERRDPLVVELRFV